MYNCISKYNTIKLRKSWCNYLWLFKLKTIRSCALHRLVTPTVLLWSDLESIRYSRLQIGESSVSARDWGNLIKLFCVQVWMVWVQGILIGLDEWIKLYNLVFLNRDFRLHQGLSHFFPGNPNFSIQILRDPKQTKASERDELVELHRVLGYFGHSTSQVHTFMGFLLWNFDFTLKYGDVFYEF